MCESFKEFGARVIYIHIYMNINLCINKSLYILYIYIYFSTEEKFIIEISTFVVDAIVTHIPRQRNLDFKQKKRKKKRKREKKKK